MEEIEMEKAERTNPDYTKSEKIHKGRKVYDPIDDTYSTGYWVLINIGGLNRWVPVWEN